MPTQTTTTKPIAQKLFARFVTGPVSDRRPDLGRCWLWTGNTGKDGYGRLYEAGRSRLAHRLMYGVVRGPIPHGLELDHLCSVRNCVNPFHAEPVTHVENVRRGRNINREKTHCLRGHAFVDGNLRTLPASRGERGCLACHCMRQHDYLRRKRLSNGATATPTFELPLAA